MTLHLAGYFVERCYRKVETIGLLVIHLVYNILLNLISTDGFLSEIAANVSFVFLVN